MWRVRPRARRCGALAGAACASAACSSVALFGVQRAGSPETAIVRVAEERGFEELSAGTFFGRGDGEPVPVRIELTLEVRARDDSVAIPGCAVQGFTSSPIRDRDFSVEAISDEGVTVTMPEGEDPIVVPPGERRLVRIWLTGPASEPDSASLGLRIDESPAVLDARTGCPDVRDTAGSVQHFGFQRVEVEPGGLAAAVGALALVAVVVLAG